MRKVRLRRPAPRDLFFPFGKHRGEPLESAPPDYLIWCLCYMDELSPTLERAMIDILFRNRGGPPEGDDEGGLTAFVHPYPGGWGYSIWSQGACLGGQCHPAWDRERAIDEADSCLGG